jgi:peptidoglycan/LPS O-acetylase OafA/YrhL
MPSPDAAAMPGSSAPDSGCATPERQVEAAPTSSPSAHLRLDTQIPALDGVRGIAVLLVMLLHFTGSMHPVTWGDHLFLGGMSFGWVGVDLFFVLSGFLITGILWDSKGSRHYFRNFYARRVLRIFPLYYGVLFAMFVVAPLLRPGVRQLVTFRTLEQDQWWFWTYLENVLFARQPSIEAVAGHDLVGHFWSLAVEEQFYLIWPLVVFLCAGPALKRVCAVCIGGALLFRLGMLYRDGEASVAGYILMPARLDALAVGAWLAVTLRVPIEYERLRRWARPTFLAAAGCFLLLSLPDLLEHGQSRLSAGIQGVGYTLLALCFGALIVIALDTRDRAPTSERFFGSSTLAFFGKYSYALYVFHLPVRFALDLGGLNARTFSLPGDSPLLRAIAFSIFSIALSTALAFLSWHAYEKHFLRLKRLFPRRG